MAAPVEWPAAWDDVAGPRTVRGFDLAAAQRAAINEYTRGRVEPEQLLAAGEAWAVLDYHTATAADLRGTAEWSMERTGTAYGLAVWFQAELAEGIGFGTGPGTRTIYQTAFFPWTQPLPLSPGDRVRVELQARLVAGDYVWVWNSTIERAGQPPVEFRQSTFLANPPSPARLRKRADGFRATLDHDGRIDAYVLGRMDGSATLGEIARELAERFPARFPTWEAALAHVGRLSEQYAE
jgi:protein arginine N-methyltransferase 1